MYAATLCVKFTAEPAAKARGGIICERYLYETLFRRCARERSVQNGVMYAATLCVKFTAEPAAKARGGIICERYLCDFGGTHRNEVYKTA